jgi:hypothetical protein
MSLRIFVLFSFRPGKYRIVPKIRAWPLPSTCFPIHHSLITLSFYATYSELLKEWRRASCWRQYVHLKRRSAFMRWHDVVSQKAVFSCYLILFRFVYSARCLVLKYIQSVFVQ